MEPINERYHIYRFVSNEDLYEITYDVVKRQVTEAMVSTSNSLKPWHDVDLKDLPNEIMERLVSALAKQDTASQSPAVS